MINIKSFFITGAVISILSGSGIKYNIQPHFNEDKAQLTIDTLLLKNASLVNQHGKYDSKKKNKFQRYKASYRIDNPMCKQVRYSIMTADKRTYFSDNFEMFLRTKAIKEGNNCKITKITNIRMHKCKDPKDKDRFYISSSVIAPTGGFSKREYLMVDQSCFSTMKNHFTNRAKADSIRVINTTTDKEAPIKFQWQQKDNLNSEISFSKAKEYCSNLTLDGNNNWRLPTRKEYSSTPNGYFESDEEEDIMLWTSTSHHTDNNIIWMQSLPEYDNASGYYDQRDKKAYVKCVRDR